MPLLQENLHMTKLAQVCHRLVNKTVALKYKVVLGKVLLKMADIKEF
jgi:hypothetical protein